MNKATEEALRKMRVIKKIVNATNTPVEKWLED